MTSSAPQHLHPYTEHTPVELCLKWYYFTWVKSAPTFFKSNKMVSKVCAAKILFVPFKDVKILISFERSSEVNHRGHPQRPFTKSNKFDVNQLDYVCAAIIFLCCFCFENTVDDLWWPLETFLLMSEAQTKIWVHFVRFEEVWILSLTQVFILTLSNPILSKGNLSFWLTPHLSFCLFFFLFPF